MRRIRLSSFTFRRDQRVFFCNLARGARYAALIKGPLPYLSLAFWRVKSVHDSRSRFIAVEARA